MRRGGAERSTVRIPGRLPFRAAAVTLVWLAGGCAYFNSLYNARRLYAEAEEARLRGDDETAAEKYREAALRAARSYRSDEEGRWADDALYLVGVSSLRRGEWDRSRAALRQVADSSADPRLRAAATLYLGAAEVATGSTEAGIRSLTRALEALDDPLLLGEGHLWRARAQLRAGWIGPGWWDLDRAEEQDARLRAPAALERLRWGIAYDDGVRAREGAHRLLAAPGAARSCDSVIGLVRGAAREWDAARAAALLEGAEDAPWSREARARLLLERAELYERAGDTSAAVRDWERVGGDAGSAAATARVRHARWRLARLEEAGGLEEARSILLPAVTSPEAAALLDGVGEVRILIESASEGSDPTPLFLAGETARDVLGAGLLARGLFLEYAERAEGEVWEGKALLAALALTPERERYVLRRRLLLLEDNPYVRVAGGEEGGEAYRRAETELGEALEVLRTALEERAAEREKVVSVPEREPPGGGGGR